jgi:hypothetical protein
MQKSRLLKTIFLIIFLSVSSFAFAQVRVNLDNLYTVTFPLNPTKTKTDTNTTVYSANQNGAFYIVMVKHMVKQFDYSTNSDSLQHFYDALLNTTVKKAGAKLVYKENLKISGNKGIDFGYTVENKAGFPDTRYQRSVYLNKTLISFSFWTFKNKLEASTADREIFFNTITTPTDEAPPAPYTAAVKAVPADSGKTPAPQIATKTTLSRVGYSVGYILGAVILTALIIGLIVFIKKTSKNKK